MSGLILLLSCLPSAGDPQGPGSTTLDASPTNPPGSTTTTTPTTPTDDPCADQPAVTWQSWGSGFFRTWCQSCHSVHTQQRNGAPEGIDFDSEAQVKSWSDTIRWTVLDEGSMPLGSGLDQDEELLLDVLLRCGLAEEPSEDEEELEITPPTPALDAAGFEAVVAAALALGLADPMTARESWRLTLEGRAPPCPSGNQWSWGSSFDGCTTDAGWQYAGIVEYSGDIETLPEDGAFSLLTDCWVVDPTGAELRAGGEAELSRTGTRWEGTASGSLAGSWSHQGQGGWLEEGFSGSLQLEASWGTEAWSLSLDGSQGTAAGVLAFEQLRVDHLDCPEGSGGSLSWRDDSGYWYRLDLGLDHHDACGCGELSYAGSTSLGSACVDLQPTAEAALEAVRPSW